jgi:hypothetical protein
MAAILRIEIAREQDGRWIGEVPELPGVLAGSTEAEARVRAAALALTVSSTASRCPLILAIFLLPHEWIAYRQRGQRVASAHSPRVDRRVEKLATHAIPVGLAAPNQRPIRFYHWAASSSGNPMLRKPWMMVVS